MNANSDLDAYFERIEYFGSTAPTLETLQALHLHHAQMIPFENLDPLLRQPVYLDLASLQKKLVHGRRGGYCFEQNALFNHVLQTLGFQVSGLVARVIWNQPEGIIPVRAHMLLRVELATQSYIADVGFGGLTLTGPLKLEANTIQSTPHESFRFLKDGSEFIMQAQVHGNWMTLYRFDLQHQYMSDYEMANWYASNYPQSLFLNGLIAARPEIDRRYALHNNELTIHYLNGKTERRTLTTVAEISSALQELIHITLPNDISELDLVLQRLIRAEKAN